MNGRLWSWTCKARLRSTRRPCGEELGIVEDGVLRVRVGLTVAVEGSRVIVTCPANHRHHRAWDTSQRRAA
jgi:hypothetical protein